MIVVQLPAPEILEACLAGGPAHRWGPVTTVKVPQRCASCGKKIPQGGTKKIGTLAYYCAELRMWNCVPCREESYRIDELNGHPRGVHP